MAKNATTGTTIMIVVEMRPMAVRPLTFDLKFKRLLNHRGDIFHQFGQVAPGLLLD